MKPTLVLDLEKTLINNKTISNSEAIELVKSVRDDVGKIILYTGSDVVPKPVSEIVDVVVLKGKIFGLLADLESPVVYVEDDEQLRSTFKRMCDSFEIPSVVIDALNISELPMYVKNWT